MFATETSREVPAAEAPCPVCGDRFGYHIFTDTGTSRDIFKCETCTTTFVSPPVERDFKNMPASLVEVDASETARQAADFWLTYVLLQNRTKTFGAPDRRSGGELTGEQPSVLEAGCAEGHLLAHFQANGWNVRGVDPWIAAAAAGRDRYRFPIETAALEQARIEPESQDVVISLEVLQGVGKPRDFLDACRNALKPGGMIFLTAPNFACAESRREAWNWRFFLPQLHVNYFTEAGLRRLLGNAGLVQIKISTFGGPDDDLLLRAVARRPAVSELSWADISEDVADEDLPVLDRQSIDVAKLSPEQRSWRENGYVIAKGLIPGELIDRYCAVRMRQPLDLGWASPAPYHEVPEIKDLCLYKPLTDLIEELIGEPMGLHLNLTGWTSTERDWHQDDYLNPPVVNGHYAAVWTALDRIRPDAGPFEFVPGSHKWPIIRQAKILNLLGYDDPRDPHWPWESERLLTPFFEREIKRRGPKIERFLGSKGDVLIWHSRLLHRGSLPERPGAERRSMIAHYSAIKYRPDMPHVRRHRGGGQYFVLKESDVLSRRLGAVASKVLRVGYSRARAALGRER